jgi:hypothetical protein
VLCRSSTTSHGMCPVRKWSKFRFIVDRYWPKLKSSYQDYSRCSTITERKHRFSLLMETPMSTESKVSYIVNSICCCGHSLDTSLLTTVSLLLLMLAIIFLIFRFWCKALDLTELLLWRNRNNVQFEPIISVPLQHFAASMFLCVRNSIN